MSKVGAIVTISTGSFCFVTLDSGEQVRVRHESSDAPGLTGDRLIIDHVKIPGWSVEPLAVLDLRTAQGVAAFGTIARVANLDNRPVLRILVAYVEQSESVADLARRCRDLSERGRQ